MSYDVGNNQSSTDYEMKARIRAAIDIEGLKWDEFCQAVGYSPDRILQAIHEGSAGVHRNGDVLARIAIVLGRDMSWIVTGSCEAECSFKESLRERVRRLVHEFIYKAEVPQDHRRGLVKKVDSLVLALNCSTERAAYRLGVPRTWKDVGSQYNEMLSELNLLS